MRPVEAFRGAPAKSAVLGACLTWLVAMAAWGARWGIAAEAIVGLAMVILGYGLLAALSYGSPRLRLVATLGALALTLAVAWATFTHLLLVVPGLVLTLGALMPRRA